METVEQARERIAARRRELRAELAHADRELGQLDVTVLVSPWWRAPSGPGKRGTAYHRDEPGAWRRKCVSGDPRRITLYEAGRAGLNPCRRCRP